MPEAFCGLEMCAKRLSELCALCERKNSPLRVSNNLSLTENHRRTEHTGFHRDIKSTDFTERYSQHPSPNTLLLLIINTQQPSPNTHQPIRQSHYSKLARLAFVKINDNLQGSRAQDDVRTAHISNFSSQSDRIDKLPISRQKPSCGN